MVWLCGVKQVPAPAQAADGGRVGMAKPTHTHSMTCVDQKKEIIERGRGSKEQQVRGKQLDLENRDGEMFVCEATH